MGRVGTGKSTLARALAEAIGAALFSSDKIRKELAGVPLHERADPDTRGRLYSEEMTRRTYAEMLSRALRAATTDGAAVVDATFGKHSQRELLRQKTNVRCLRVLLDVSDAEIKQRLQNRSSAQISDARLEDFEMLDAAYEHPDAIEQNEIVMINSGSTLESTVTAVFQLLIRIDAH